MVRGLPESKEKGDEDLVSELFKDIGCLLVEITSTVRLGRKEVESKTRPLRVILKKTKKQRMKY